MRLPLPAFLVAALLFAGPNSARPQAPASSCDLAAARPWIERWLAAWELTSREILRLPDAPAPGLVFYDSACVYTTAAASAPGANVGDGPRLRGAKLPWRAAAHDDSLTLPDGTRLPVQLMSFAKSDRHTGPYFVMAAPSYWRRMGVGSEDDRGFTGVFIHEFAHTRQIRGMARVIGPIDSAWRYAEELDDDAVQKHFGSDTAYVAAYRAERELVFRAAAAPTTKEARALAWEVLAAIRGRHARWFTGDKTEFAVLDDTFLSMEGAAQWAAAAWLAHPEGGAFTQEAAVAKMLGRRRWWVQDEGLGLFLLIDRLLPGWPRLVFNEPSMGAIALLERAVAKD